jgi:hypothetical protein
MECSAYRLMSFEVELHIFKASSRVKTHLAGGGMGKFRIKSAKVTPVILKALRLEKSRSERVVDVPIAEAASRSRGTIEEGTSTGLALTSEAAVKARRTLDESTARGKALISKATMKARMMAMECISTADAITLSVSSASAEIGLWRRGEGEVATAWSASTRTSG